MNIDISSDLTASKASVFRGIKAIKANHNPRQPWLTPPTPQRRSNTTASKQGKRAAINGNVRTLALSDMGSVYTCEVGFVASLLGEQLINTPGEGLYRGKGGTMLHEECERLLANTGEWATSVTAKNQMFVHLPSLGCFTEPAFTGKKTAGIYGIMDGFNNRLRTGLEIKIVPEGEELPDNLPKRAETQGALYSKGVAEKTRRYPAFFFWIYLPSNLDNLDPYDLSTYRVFYRTADELREVASDVWRRAQRLHGVATLEEGNLTAALNRLHCLEPSQCKTCPNMREWASSHQR